MTALDRLHQAEAAAREAHAEYAANPHVRGCADACAYALRDLLAALDAARGEAVEWQWRWIETDDGPGTWVSCNKDEAALIRGKAGCEVRELFAAPPAALAVPAEVCGACGKAWTGGKCGQAENDWPFRVCYPVEAQQPAAAVPEGYALVPVEPTTEMKCRAVEAWEGPAVYKSMFARGLADLEDRAAECWAAMLAAANKESGNG